MKVYILTDLEGISGVDTWEQCYPNDRGSTDYRRALRHLTEEVNAAVAGAFDGGASEVFVVDGHGVNYNRGFIADLLDPRARKVFIAEQMPLHWEALDDRITCVAMIGQHAMAGTINGFLDHTQNPKVICKLMFNGREHGELSQFAIFAGAFGIPLVYASGDEALCDEAKQLIPGIMATPTKRGTGWATCELYNPTEIRDAIRRDFTQTLRNRATWPTAMQIELPAKILTEWAWSEHADLACQQPNVERVNARSAQWWIGDPLDIYAFPCERWHPRVSIPQR